MDSFLGNSVISGDIPLPVLTLNETSLTSNIAAMSAYCAERGVYLAPHAKTHMIAEIVSKQIQDGAWGASVATVEQALTVAEWHVERIVIANEVTGKANLVLLRELLRRHNELQVYVLADSVAGVALLAAIMADLHEPLSVLLEVGFGGRRAGVRDRDRAFGVARAISETSCLKLVGLEMYEGAVAADRSPGSLSNVDAALAETLRLARDMRRLGLFADEEAILSAGGSVFFDRVVDAWADKPDGFMILLRSGAYASHDDGHYERLSPLDLSPALVVWANVLSVPEPECRSSAWESAMCPMTSGCPCRNGWSVTAKRRQPRLVGAAPILTTTTRSWTPLMNRLRSETSSASASLIRARPSISGRPSWSSTTHAWFAQNGIRSSNRSSKVRGSLVGCSYK